MILELEPKYKAYTTTNKKLPSLQQILYMYCTYSDWMEMQTAFS